MVNQTLRNLFSSFPLLLFVNKFSLLFSVVQKRNLIVFSIFSSKTFALRQDRHPAYTTGLATYTTFSLC